MTQFNQDHGAEPPRLGRYEVLGEIASGGMATVFLARSLGAGGFTRLMAIKRLHPHLESDEDFVRMFLDEARLAARIRHPNVVATLDVEDEDGLYIVMEYIEGVTLLQLSRAAQRVGERIPIPVAARISLDTLAGLHAAHELHDESDQFLNLVHRDVSPQNVLLGTDGAARLTDFGIAKAASRLSMTRDGQLKGKISYMAPEQTRRGEVDRRADIFTMGIVVWELLAGRRLFSGETDVEVLNQLLFEPIPRLKDHAPTLPSMLEQTVMRALDRDPAARYATASQFADAIERATRMVGGAANHRVVAAFIQKVAGERIARERVRISSGAPVSEAASTGNFRALDGTGAPPSRVRSAAIGPPPERAFEPMSPQPRRLRAPTMTGPVYAPDEPPSAGPPRGQRRPPSLRPPTMPALGLSAAEREAQRDGYGGAQAPSGPPAIIEFQGSEPQWQTPSPLRGRTPPPILRSTPPPALDDLDEIDHEAVTQFTPMYTPQAAPPARGSEAETLSMPVSMLLGPPPATPQPPGPRGHSQSEYVHQASHPFASPQQLAPQQHVAQPQPEAPLQMPPGAYPAQPAVVGLPPPEAPVVAQPAGRAGARLLIALALVLAMGLGAGLTLYLTGNLDHVLDRVRNEPAPPRRVVPLIVPLLHDAAAVAVDDASAMVTADVAVESDASATIIDEAAVESDASAMAADDASERDAALATDAEALTTGDDAGVVDAATEPVEAVTGPRHRRHRRRDDDAGAARPHAPAGAEPTLSPTVTGPLGDPFGPS
jgi:serine/threonine-protein kinase